MKIILALAAFILFGQKANLQNLSKPEINIDKLEYNFGNVRDNSRILEAVFNISNLGTAPLIIYKVQPACGCTTPSLSKDTILSGKTAVLKIGYQPQNRPGAFLKTISIISNDANEITVLTIKGVVIPTPKSIIEEFPDSIGNLRFTNTYLNMGNMLTNRIGEKSIEIYNKGSKEILIADSFVIPKHISLIFSAKQILPQSKIKLTILYDAKKKNDYGFVNDNISIFTSDSISKKDLVVFATIEEFFPPLTPQDLQKSPKIKIEKYEINLGRIGNASPVQGQFTFKNIGKKILQIKKTKPSCVCVMAETKPSSLGSGESGTVNFTIDPKDKEGLMVKTITLFTNDPINPIQILTIKAEVFTQ